MLGASTTETKPPHPRRRACIRCTTAKSKCVLLKDRLACERCTRLERDCKFDDSAQPRKRQSGTRVEKLEEKVEALVAALKAQKGDVDTTPQQTPESTTSPSHSYQPSSSEQDHLPPINSPDAAPLSVQSARQPALATQFEQPNLDYRQYSDGGVNTSFSSPDVIDRQLLTLELADALVEKYRRLKFIHFPFVVIPDGVSASQLRRECPFLFLTILAASSEDRFQLQKALAKEIKREVSRRIMEREEKSLELLQGLLINVCFHHYHLPDSKQMFMYLQVAISLVSDLCLDRSPAAPGSIDHVHYNYTPHATIAAKRSRSAAEQRTYLGLHYLHSVGTPFRRTTILKQTPYMMQCCDTLEKQREYPSDAWLRIYMQTSLISRKIEEVSNRDGNIQNASDGMLDMVIDVIRKEIAKLEHDAVTVGVDGDHCLMLLMKFLYVSVHELSLRKAPDEAPTQMMSRTSQGWALLSSVNTLIERYAALGSEPLQHMPALTFATSWYTFILLSRIALMPSGPHWNQDQARKLADIPMIAKQVKAQLLGVLHNIRSDNDADDTEDIWNYFCRAIDAVARLNAQGVLRTARNSPRALEPQHPPNTLPPIQPSPLANDQLPRPADLAQAANTAMYGDPSYNPNMGPQPVMQLGDQEMIDIPGIWDDAAWQRIMADIPMDPSALSMDNNIFGYQLF